MDLFQIFLCLSISAGNKSGYLCEDENFCLCFPTSSRRHCLKSFHKRNDYGACRLMILENGHLLLHFTGLITDAETDETGGHRIDQRLGRMCKGIKQLISIVRFK